MTCSVLVQPYQQRCALALALGVVILVLAFVGHVSAINSHHGPEQVCHHHTCWILTPEPTLPSAVTVLASFASMFRFTLSQEHGFRIFKPPRLCPPSIHL
jgi:hypothetical protein